MKNIIRGIVVLAFIYAVIGLVMTKSIDFASDHLAGASEIEREIKLRMVGVRVEGDAAALRAETTYKVTVTEAKSLFFKVIYLASALSFMICLAACSVSAVAYFADITHSRMSNVAERMPMTELSRVSTLNAIEAERGGLAQAEKQIEDKGIYRIG